MLKKIFNVILAIVKQIAIAFFFTSIIVLILCSSVKKTTDVYLKFISTFAVEASKGEEIELEVNPVSKKLIQTPAYGTAFATLIIPDMNFRERVVHGDSLKIIKNDVGHQVGSYFPGEGATIILCAHNSRKHFMYLPKVEIGHLITIETDYGVFNYKVYETKVIKDTDFEALKVQKDKERLVIFTCYPTYTVGPKDHRYVVYAELDSAEYKGDKQ